jgi:tripeptidyl-peptidase-1
MGMNYMRCFSRIFCFLSLIMFAKSFVVRERIKLHGRMIKHSPADPDLEHELVIAVQQQNLDVLESIVYNISSPESANYQQWLTRQEIVELTANNEAARAIEDWLRENGVKLLWSSKNKSYMKVLASISKWESLLRARFYVWKVYASIKNRTTYSKIVRSYEYSLPAIVDGHISAVFNTVQVPPLFTSSTVVLPVNSHFVQHEKVQAISGSVTVPFLNEFYQISNNTGSPSISQSVLQMRGSSYSTVDLQMFQAAFDLPMETPSVIGGHQITDLSCTPSECGEGNLDIQYIMGLAQVQRFSSCCVLVVCYASMYNMCSPMCFSLSWFFFLCVSALLVIIS